MSRLLRSLAPNLNRHVVHGQRDRGLGLGCLDPHAFQLEVGEQTVGDRAAQALERAIGALLGHQRHQLADLRVVDRVLHSVGHGGIRFPHIQAQVDQQSLADLALGLAHAVVCVERETVDLDRDGLEALFVLFVLFAVFLVVVVLLLGVLASVSAVVLGTVLVVQLVLLLAVHLPPNVAAATASAAATGATSCTRKTLAPRSSAITFVAIVPGSLASAASGSRAPPAPAAMRPRNVLREVPITSGGPSVVSSSSRRSNVRLCAGVLPKPMPGSSRMRRASMPASTASSRR